MKTIVPEKTIPAKILSDEEMTLCALVDDHQKDLIDLVKSLISIDSRIYDNETFVDQSQVFSFIEEFMKGFGANCDYYQCQHPYAPEGSLQEWPSMIAAFGTKENGKDLQFCGHVDVVPFTREKWSSDPFDPVIKDGKIFGRGASDMKSGLACLMSAFKLLVESGIQMYGRLQMVFFPDEEINGDYGSQFMATKYKDAIDAPTIIGEPTGQPPLDSPAIIIGEKGHAWLRLKFFGASGHGSMPRPRSNAINKAARFISHANLIELPKAKAPMGVLAMLKGLLSRISLKNMLAMTKASDAAPDPYNEDGLGVGNFFKSTISFSQIHAGTKINVIPDTCDLEIDIRVLPGITLQHILDSIAWYCTEMGFHIELPEGCSNLQLQNKKLQKRPVDVALSVISTTLGTFEDMRHPFMQLLKQTFEDIYHVKAIHFFAPGGSDAVSFRMARINDVVLLGPTGGHAHEENEFVWIDQLVKICKVYLLVAYRMLCK